MTLLSVHEASRKKQLGQYFTGQRVGRLLAALADSKSAKSIIDPMVGSGDLLVSCLAVGASPEKLVGLELDPLALRQATDALDGVAGAELVLTDAFSATLPAEQFDLVITNPPYIRYQSKGEVDGVDIPSSDAVRDGLVRAIKARGELSEGARTLLLHAARSYPGTADIAVPAWILSASLVREGGVLAVVAPQAWLSRNYAHAVRELLDKAFDVEIIVEDGDASWFNDAQVRTNLVVARRRAIAAITSARPVVLARATRELDTDGTLRGSLDSEWALATSLRKVTAIHPIAVTTGLTARVEHDLSVAASGQTGHIPSRLAAAIGVAPGDIVARTLESYGWRVGQGLRTGANDFFYVSDVAGVLYPDARWGIKSLAIPPECLRPAVRRQREIGVGLDIRADTPLPSRVMNLRGWVTAADLKTMGDVSDVSVLPTQVAQWIAQVASAPLHDTDLTKLFPDLTAVATNGRNDRSGRPVSFWYQLPELRPRHQPELFLARVCGGQPTAYANSARAVVDANFSTLWPVEKDALPAEALLALLHSSWVWASLEAACTVLGGGALKVEATDLRRLALPNLAADDIARFVELGRTLLAGVSDDHDPTRDIDEAVASILAPGRSVEGRVTGPRDFAERSLEHRSRN